MTAYEDVRKVLEQRKFYLDLEGNFLYEFKSLASKGIYFMIRPKKAPSKTFHRVLPLYRLEELIAIQEEELQKTLEEFKVEVPQPA